MKHLNDKEHYEVIQFEDGCIDRYYLVHKAEFKYVVKEYKDKQAREG